MSETYEYDFFICHASEDRDVVVRPLAEQLRGSGFRVWYDEYELKVGASLRDSIDRGLRESRFGIVVLSPSFFAKRKTWTKKELGALESLEGGGRTTILPVWHDISFDEIREHSPLLADRFAARTYQGLDAVISELVIASGLEAVPVGPTAGVPVIGIPEVVGTPASGGLVAGNGLLLGGSSPHELEDQVFTLCSDQGSEEAVRILRRELRALSKALFEGRAVDALVGAQASESLLEDPYGSMMGSILRIPPVLVSLMDCGENEAARAVLDYASQVYSRVPATGDARIGDPLALQKQLLYSAFAVGALAIERAAPSVATALLGWENARDSYWEGRSWIRYVATMLARKKIVGKSIINSIKEHWAPVEYLSDSLGGEDGVWNRLCQFDFLQCANVVASGGEIGDCFASFSVFRRSRVQPMIEALIDSHDEGIWIPALDSADLARLIVALDEYATKWAGFEYDSWEIDRWSSSKIRMFLAKEGHEVR